MWTHEHIHKSDGRSAKERTELRDMNQSPCRLCAKDASCCAKPPTDILGETASADGIEIQKMCINQDHAPITSGEVTIDFPCNVE